jgi:hypothetical protein
VQLEDGRAHLPHGLVEVVDGPVQPLDDRRGEVGPEDGLEAEAGGEQALDHPVVEVAGDALAVLEHHHLAHPLVEAGLLDGEAGGDGQGHGHLLVDVGEDLLALAVAQVEVAEDLVADADGHAEERRHRRVVRGEPEAVGMLAQVRQPDRLGVDDQQAQDAVALGQLADGPPPLLVDADGDELREPGAGLVEHAERAVAGLDQVGGRLGDAPQDARQVEVRADAQHGVEEAPQGLRAGVLSEHGGVHRRRLPPVDQAPERGTTTGRGRGARIRASRSGAGMGRP